MSVLEWYKERYVCILSVVMRQVSPEERNMGISILVVQHDVSELVWPPGAERWGEEEMKEKNEL